MDFGILGPLVVRRGGTTVELGAPKLRALLIRLLVDLGHTVSTDRLIEGLWYGDPPAGALASLRAYISNLRRHLGEEGEHHLVTRSGGYALELPADVLDAERFAMAVDAARGCRERSEAGEALDRLNDALALWRGPALVDVADAGFAQPTIHRLEELRNLAREERIGALLALGRHNAAIADLESMVATTPLRERPHRQLTLALYRAGRTPEALQVHRDLRHRLADELGLDPSPRFEDLVARILRQDPSLVQEPIGSAPAPPTTVTGPDAPEVGATRAGGIASRPVASITGPPGIIGRRRERSALLGSLDRLGRGDGGLVLIAGEPGIGKTTLLQELGRTASATAAAVHASQCSGNVGAPAFWPWSRALRSIAAATEPEVLTEALHRAPAVLQLLPELAELTSASPPPVGDDLPAARFGLYDATATLLTAVAAERPQVILLDDLHFADPPSLELLTFLAEQLVSVPVLLAGSYRSTIADVPPALAEALGRLSRRTDVAELHLEGLTRDEVAEIVRATGRSADDSQLASLHDRTDGNPFFVWQLVHLLDGAGRRLSDARIPTGVRHVIASRVQLLDAGTQRLLETAAVIGRTFDTRVLATASGRPVGEVLEELDLAHRHGLVEPAVPPGRRHRFVHALIRETLHDGLSPASAAQLHARVAAAFRASGDTTSEVLAEHLWRAGELAPEGAALQALVEAADAATDALAYERAELMLRRALELLEGRRDVDAEVAVRVRLVSLLTSVSGWATEDVATIADRVRWLTDEVGLRPDLLPLWHLLWTGLSTRGEIDRGREVATELLERAVNAENELFTHTAELMLGYLAAQRGDDVAGALARIVEAREGLDRQPEAHLAATPEHLGVTARLAEVCTRALLNDASTGSACQELLAYADRIDRPFSRVAASLFAGWAAAVTRDVRSARSWTDAGMALCARFGFRGANNMLIPVNAWARAELGAEPLEQAERISEALVALGANRHQHVMAQWLVLLVEVELRADRPREAARRLQETRDVVAATGERVYDPQIARVAALVSARLRDERLAGV